MDNQNGRISFGPAGAIVALYVNMRMYISSKDGADGVGIVFGDAVYANTARSWDHCGQLGGAGVGWAFTEY